MLLPPPPISRTAKGKIFVTVESKIKDSEFAIRILLVDYSAQVP
jgi:hypothetical protein